MMKNKYILKSLLLLSFLAMGTNAVGQTTKERPDVATSNQYWTLLGGWQDRVQNKENAIDNDETTFANLTANAGLLAGIGSHYSELTLDYNTAIESNPKYFVKISSPDFNNLLGVLLGGSLGNLLADLGDILLFGDASAEFELYNTTSSTTNPVIAGDIFNNSFPSNPDMNVGIDGAGNYYLVMQPDDDFNQLKISFSSIALVGLLSGGNAQLEVYDAYYYDN